MQRIFCAMQQKFALQQGCNVDTRINCAMQHNKGSLMVNSQRKTSPVSPDVEPANTDGPEIAQILIKKYPNRRLYNTATSSYIVLDDIVELIKSDTSFIIRDTKSNEDITRSILNQIIFEQEVKPNDYHFPLEVQKQLISMYGDTYASMVPDYLTQSMNLFVNEKTKMSEAMGDVVSRNTKAMMDFSQNIARQNMELFKKSWEIFGVMNDTAQNKSETDTSSTLDTQKDEETNRETELEKIQAEMDKLQNRLKSLK